MVTVPVLFDTNILIDYLKGIEVARNEIDHYSDRAISLVTWMEVVVGATPADESDVRSFLQSFVILPIEQRTAEQAVVNRRGSRLKLPDAIILAAAQVSGRLLITRNTRDFAAGTPGVRIPYTI